MENVESRGCVTIIMWLSYLGFIYFAMDSLGLWAALLAFVLMIPLVVAMGATWNMFGNEDRHLEHVADTEKRKRERIDSVLRDLSSDDLIALRERLKDGSIDDEVLYERLVGDDGEFVSDRRADEA